MCEKKLLFGNHKNQIRMFDKTIYRERRRRLCETIGEGIVLFPGNTDMPMNYKDNPYLFRQDSSFLYFFGLDFPGLAGVMDTAGGTSLLFGDDVDIEDIIWMGPQEPLVDKAARSGVEKTLPFGALYDYVASAVQKGRKIHFLPPYRAENKLLLQKVTGIAAERLKDHSSLELILAISELRSVKQPEEIREIENACSTGYEMHVTAMRMAVPGVREQEIAGRIEGIALSAGGRVSFPVILSQHGETLHNHNHGLTLERGRLLLVDAGAESALHYASDFTRTIPVGGRFSPMQRDIYDVVLAANNRATKLVKPGVTYLSVHLAVSEVIAGGLKQMGLMKGDVQEAVAAGAHTLFFPHGLGHMMGLDVHDMEDLGQIHIGYDSETRPVDQFGTGYLRMGRKLREGFVITNEPGVYFIPALIEQWKNDKKHESFINYDRLEVFAGFGGIRLEDDLLVTAEGSRILGPRVPILPEEVESLAGTGI